jgi:hypothetical protein
LLTHSEWTSLKKLFKRWKKKYCLEWKTKALNHICLTEGFKIRKGLKHSFSIFYMNNWKTERLLIVKEKRQLKRLNKFWGNQRLKMCLLTTSFYHKKLWEIRFIK